MIYWLFQCYWSEWNLTFIWFSSSLLDTFQSSEDLDTLYEVRHALRYILIKAPASSWGLIWHVASLFPVVADVVCGTLSALASARLFRPGLSGSQSFSCVSRCCRTWRGAVLTWTWAHIPTCGRRVCANGTQTLIRDSVAVIFFCQLS